MAIPLPIVLLGWFACICSTDATSTSEGDAACSTLSAASEASGQSMLQTKQQKTVGSAEVVESTARSNLTRLLSTAATDRSKVMKVEGRPVFLGYLEPLDDVGYNIIANTCCRMEMEIYMRRLITSLNLELCEEAGLLQIVGLYADCVKDTGVHNFTTLKGHILAAAAPVPCQFIAAKGACPAVPRPAYCGGDPDPASHRRRQCNARIQKEAPATEPAATQCKLPQGAVWCQVRLKNAAPYWMAVYDWDVQEDWVSFNVCQAGYWEENDISVFGVPGQMLDIGGNLGYHTLAFARGGWTVTTFEPMAPNLALIQASMCRNPDLAARIHINPHGLGTVPQTCTMMSPVGNVGDGFTKCQKQSAMDFPVGFKEIGRFDIKRLDQVLTEQKINKVDLVKIDVEGYEHQVFAGAPNFLAQFRPRTILTEVWGSLVGDTTPVSGIAYLEMFKTAGYKFFSDGACKEPMDAQTKLVTAGTLDVVMCM